MHPLFDETALERVRIPGCLGILGAKADAEASLRACWSAAWSACRLQDPTSLAASLA